MNLLRTASVATGLFRRVFWRGHLCDSAVPNGWQREYSARRRQVVILLTHDRLR